MMVVQGIHYQPQIKIIWNVILNVFQTEICLIRYKIKEVYSFTINA